MINISKLYVGLNFDSDKLRYGTNAVNYLHNKQENTQKSSNYPHFRKPVVVWNITRKCNLHCVHCYTNSEYINYPNELTTNEAKQVIDELASIKIPAILFSGGEPLLRNDLFEIAKYTIRSGVKAILSTNGTLITEEIANKIKSTGFSYVGISLDGIGEINDYFRGTKGAFTKALNGIRNCIKVNQKVGLRLTLNKTNVSTLQDIFEFVIREKIERLCFYHLVPSGRGSQIGNYYLTHQETREAIDKICDLTKEATSKNPNLEVLTVDNHVDGAYIYLKLLKEKSPRAEEVKNLLELNGGGLYSSAVGIACIDYEGNVHPDQFWLDYTVGNVKYSAFSKIWFENSDDLFNKLKNKILYLNDRCNKCKFVKICGGALRVRALRTFGNVWATDPACYLTDDEIFY